MLFDPRDPRRWNRNSSPEEQTQERQRGRTLTRMRVVIIVLFGLLTAQLFHMQILRGSAYDERARSNHISTTIVLPERGLIYARDGTLLVQNEPTFAAAVIPANIDPDDDVALAAELERLLNVPAATVKRIINDGREGASGYDPLTIKPDIDRETALMLSQMSSSTPGVTVVIGSRRRYTEGSLLGHITGYVGPIDAEEYGGLRDQGYGLQDVLGQAGVEAQYEGLLRGDAGFVQSEVDSAGNEIRRLDDESPTPARGIVLSIDLDLQREVTRLLQKHRGESKNMVAIVQNVRTGEILAMVSLPTYDANVFNEKDNDDEIRALLDDPGNPLLDHTIAATYPPGSTFKQVTGLAALQEGVATPDTTIESKGYLEVLNDQNEFVRYFPDWSALGVLDFYGGVAMSSDVYFYYLAGGYRPAGFQGLGEERLAQYARAFGLGRPTGIDLPGEEAGIVPDAAWKEKVVGEPWVLGDTYNFGIGQGYLTTTPLQMLNLTTAIANGGELLRPHVVTQIVDDKGRVVVPSARQTLGRLPISAENLRIMQTAMRAAITRGTATPASVPGIAVAGKTGTAEFGVQLADGTYATTHGWFTGYAPFDNPEIAIVTFVEHGGGNQNAAPLARDILDYYFNRGANDATPAGDKPVPSRPADASVERRPPDFELGPGTQSGGTNGRANP